MTMPTFEPFAFVTYKGYLLHAEDPKVLEHSEPSPLFEASQLTAAYEAGKAAKAEQEPIDERAEFEFWASDNGSSPRAVTRSGEGYLLSQTQSYWGAWKARAAIAAPPAPAVPLGWKLVPIEPTKEMNQAGFDVKGSHLYTLAYRAMIAASPEPTK